MQCISGENLSLSENRVCHCCCSSRKILLFDPIPGHGLPLNGFAITLVGHIAHDRIPPEGWLARCRDLYLSTHNTHKRQIHVPAGILTCNPSTRLIIKLVKKSPASLYEDQRWIVFTPVQHWLYPEATHSITLTTHISALWHTSTYRTMYIHLTSGWVLEDSLLDSRHEKRYSCSPVSRPVLKPTEPFKEWAHGAIFQWVKWPGREAGQPPQSCTWIKNEWIHTFTPWYVFMTCIVTTPRFLPRVLHPRGLPFKIF